MELTNKLKEDFIYYVGSRDIQRDLYQYMYDSREIISEPVYRGMMFPVHLIQEGTVIQEWHMSSHWSTDMEIAKAFAIHGYINEDYADELCVELGIDYPGLELYQTGCGIFTPVILTPSESILGFRTGNLLNQLEELNTENEITTLAMDTVIKEIIPHENYTHLVVSPIYNKPIY